MLPTLDADDARSICNSSRRLSFRTAMRHSSASATLISISSSSSGEDLALDAFSAVLAAGRLGPALLDSDRRRCSIDAGTGCFLLDDIKVDRFGIIHFQDRLIGLRFIKAIGRGGVFIRIRIEFIIGSGLALGDFFKNRLLFGESLLATLATAPAPFSLAGGRAAGRRVIIDVLFRQVRDAIFILQVGPALRA